MKKVFILVLAVFVGLLASACSPADEDTGQAGLLNTEQLVSALAQESEHVEGAGEVMQPFFEPEGSLVDVDGEQIQVFEFATAEEAEAAAASISPDGGSVGTSMMMWVGTPHFYHSGKLVVIYVGEDVELMEKLEVILGEQIAGG